MSKSTSVETHLRSLLPDDARASLRDEVLPKLLNSIHEIAGHLRTSPSVTQVGTANAFGDDQYETPMYELHVILH
jgi:sedoheptulose-bisphosphatase